MKSDAIVLQHLLRAAVDLDRDVVLAGMAKALAHSMPLHAAFALHCEGDQMLVLDRVWTPEGIEAGGGACLHISASQTVPFWTWFGTEQVLYVPTLEQSGFAVCLRTMVIQRLHVVDASLLILQLPPEDGQHRILVLAADHVEAYTSIHRELCASLKTALGLSDRLIQTHERLERMQRHLEQERQMLRRAFIGPATLVGTRGGLADMMALAGQLSKISQPVLLLGELGVGKSRVASLIHEKSVRREAMMVRLDCAAVPLLPAADKGQASWKDMIVAAHGGTLFLAGVSTLPDHAQQVILRLIRDKSVDVDGREQRVDVRVIASARGTLEGLVAAGRFNAELFQRLSVFLLPIPPLRERRQDIPELIQALLNDKAPWLQLRELPAVRPEDVQTLTELPWKGNVLELETVITQALLQWQQRGQMDAPLDFAFVSELSA